MDLIIFVVMINGKIDKVQVHCEKNVKILITEFLQDSKTLVEKYFTSQFSGEKEYIVFATVRDGKLESFSAMPNNLVCIFDAVSIVTQHPEDVRVENFCLTSSLFHIAPMQSDTVM